MKSERRHELEHNALADWLVKAYQDTSQHKNAIIVLIAILGYTTWRRYTSMQANSASLAVFDAGNDPNELVKVREDYPRTGAAELATVAAADLYLAEGTDWLFQNKERARTQLRTAVENYQIALSRTSDDNLRQRATYGMARAREALGELDAARTLYREIGEKWPQGTYANTARTRLADLERTETKWLYDQMAKFDPSPAFSTDPNLPGNLPFDIRNVPDEPPTTPPVGTGTLEEMPALPGDASASPAEPVDAASSPVPADGRETSGVAPGAGEAVGSGAPAPVPTEDPAASAESMPAPVGAPKGDPDNAPKAEGE
ncbi:MAG: hypothetical protein ACOY3P_10360 [Planctomycetota bacterium]